MFIVGAIFVSKKTSQNTGYDRTAIRLNALPVQKTGADASIITSTATGLNFWSVGIIISFKMLKTGIYSLILSSLKLKFALMPVQKPVPMPVQLTIHLPDLISHVSVQLFPSGYVKTASYSPISSFFVF